MIQKEVYSGWTTNGIGNLTIRNTTVKSEDFQDKPRKSLDGPLKLLRTIFLGHLFN